MTSVSATDSVLLGGLFASTEIARLFDDNARVQSMLDFEAALAKAEADLGIIPEGAAAAIAKWCKAGFFDMAALGDGTILGGNPAIPLVKELTAKVGGDAARFVHWGGTSQDVIDTGLALQMRRGLSALSERVGALGDALADLSAAHRKTPAIGRTLSQHALPIPFGLRTAGWLEAMTRAHTRLSRLGGSDISLHFAGAAGSLASLGRDGPAVSERLARGLDLPQPALSSHAHRDFMAEIASGLAILCGSAAKIAGDIQAMMQTDVGEVFEPAAPGKGGSSTMPHKRNPVATAAVRANARQVSALASLFLNNMDHTFERDPGQWHAESGPIAEIFVLTGGALEKLLETARGLEVDCARMRANIDRTNGLVFAEAVMMILAPVLGRPEAHHIVQDATRRALAKDRHLRDVLLDMEAVLKAATRQEIVDAFDPRGYFGASDHFIDRALQAWTDRRPDGPETKSPKTESQ